MNQKFIASLSCLCNLAIVVCVGYAIWLIFSPKTTDPSLQPKSACFHYFTIDSNILVALFSVPMLIYGIMSLFKEISVPQWVCTLKYIGTVSVMLTMLTVVCFLVPTSGKEGMYTGFNFYMHLLVPILACLSFVLLDGSVRLPWKSSLLGLIPTVLYGIVYVYMVLIRTKENGGWGDFYGFNRGGKWYIAIFAMLTSTYVISLLLNLLRNIRLNIYS